jgi:hypothetical protein
MSENVQYGFLASSGKLLYTPSVFKENPSTYNGFCILPLLVFIINGTVVLNLELKVVLKSGKKVTVFDKFKYTLSNFLMICAYYFTSSV